MSDVGNVRRKLGYADFFDLPNDGLLREIIGGEHVVIPAASKRHGVIAAEIFSRLEAFLADGALGRVLRPPCLVKLSDCDIIKPDLFFLAAARLDLLDGQLLEGAPDLVVEVLADWTGRKKDLLLKHRLYERYGVREYWMVDPVTRKVRVDRLKGGALRQVDEQSGLAGGVVTSPLLLPGFELRLTGLFPRPRGPHRGTV
jgi:Uma2 family endonuclease